MTRGLKIGIDLDDCLVDFISEFVRVCNTMFGRPEIGARPSDWEWSNFGLSAAQLDDAWDKIKSTHSFWCDLPIEPGFDVVDFRNFERENEIFFITARVQTLGPLVSKQSAIWLRSKLGISYPTVIVSSTKGPLAQALALDYFIDDRPKNCLEVKGAAPKCRVYLKNSSHNQDFDGRLYGISRVADLREFMNIVREEDCRTKA